MTFARKFPIGRFDFGLRRIRLDAQDSVVVNHCACLYSESQRWMPGLPEDTASLARKVYHRPQVVTVRFLTSTEMFELALGGAKGEPGKIPRAAFEGARTIIKATRTLWLVVLSSTTAMPCPQFSKTPAKIGHFLIHTPKVCTTEDSRCLPPTTHLLLTGPIHDPQQRSHSDSRWSL